MKQNKRHGSPTFYALLEEMADTHDKKSHDYASDKNPYGNYHFAGMVANLFAHSPQDAGFAGRIAEKIYRLSNLEGSGKQAKNESVEDTERDIVVIAALWMADRRDRRKNNNPTTELYYCYYCGKTRLSGAILMVGKKGDRIICFDCDRKGEDR